MGDPTEMLLDGRRLASWLNARAFSTATVVIDGGVTGHEITTLIGQQVGAACTRVGTVVVEGPGSISDAAALRDDLGSVDCIVAVGGGALLDRAKLGAAVAADGSVLDELRAAGRRGLVALPQRPAPGPLLVAVPTTVGTGSERSGNAVVTATDGRLLVAGAQLTPALGVLDAIATRGLPRQLLLEGAFEALCRVTGPYVGSPAAPAQDALAEAVAARLVALGEGLRRSAHTGDPSTDRQRLELARLSGLGHTAAMHAGRDPFGFKPWYVSHELAWSAGMGKAHALAVVLPAVWRAVLAGETRWGSAARLRRIWSTVTAGSPAPLPGDPVDGLADLTDRWGVPHQAPPGGGHAEAVAARLIDRWGEGLPCLGELDEQALTLVLRDALGTSSAPVVTVASPSGAGAQATSAMPRAGTPEVHHGPSAMCRTDH
jgi:alcohol dehydrogenase class IV